jgi:hypothetical protein
MNRTLRASVMGLAVALVAVGIGGCLDSAASAVTRDMIDGRRGAELEVDLVRRQASERYRKASDEVASALHRARLAAAQGEREIALAQARVRFESSLRHCKSLDGELRRACHVQAQAGYADARNAARRIEYAYVD